MADVHTADHGVGNVPASGDSVPIGDTVKESGRRRYVRTTDATQTMLAYWGPYTEAIGTVHAIVQARTPTGANAFRFAKQVTAIWDAAGVGTLVGTENFNSFNLGGGSAWSIALILHTDNSLMLFVTGAVGVTVDWISWPDVGILHNIVP